MQTDWLQASRRGINGLRLFEPEQMSPDDQRMPNTGESSSSRYAHFLHAVILYRSKKTLAIWKCFFIWLNLQDRSRSFHIKCLFSASTPPTAGDVAVAGGSVEVLGSLAETCHIFVTPLGLEVRFLVLGSWIFWRRKYTNRKCIKMYVIQVTERLLTAGALEWTHQHPLFIVQQLFTRCSFSQHKQPLIRQSNPAAPLQRLQVI